MSNETTLGEYETTLDEYDKMIAMFSSFAKGDSVEIDLKELSISMNESNNIMNKIGEIIEQRRANINTRITGHMYCTENNVITITLATLDRDAVKVHELLQPLSRRRIVVEIVDSLELRDM